MKDSSIIMENLIREIVTNSRSKAFGKKSCFYIGWTQNNNSESAINSRIELFKMQLENKQDFLGRKIPNDFFIKKAKFTLKHYKDKGFTGAFFQQWDEKYPRSCSAMDYTPETLPEVIEFFKSWMSPFFNTKKIMITRGKKTIQEIITGRKLKRSIECILR